MNTLPILGLNGSSPESLGNEYLEAYKSLLKFSEKFFSIDFHARDYMVVSPEYWEGAIKQRDEIKQKISDIRKYLDHHASHCFSEASKKVAKVS
jgi:hypothetical protein